LVDASTTQAEPGQIVSLADYREAQEIYEKIYRGKVEFSLEDFRAAWSEVAIPAPAISGHGDS
jgi:hypothetical protein